jgi:molecular chaperone DnaK (HSP70)
VAGRLGAGGPAGSGRRRNNEPVAYRINFGATNSSIAAAYRDRIEVIPVESRGIPEFLPSIIYLNRGRNRAAGQEAIEQFLVTGSQKTPCGRCNLVRVFDRRRESDCRQFQPGGGCYNARLISGIKSDLSETDFVSTHSWATDFTLTDLVSVIMRRLKAAADRATGSNMRWVVLGHPVVSVGAEGPYYRERQAVVEERIRDAAVEAGFTEVVLLYEPAAAVINEDLREGVALAADFGGVMIPCDTPAPRESCDRTSIREAAQERVFPGQGWCGSEAGHGLRSRVRRFESCWGRR